MLRDMVNIFTLALAEILELISTILAWPAQLVGELSSFFYVCSRALDNNDEQDDIDNGSIQ